MDCSGHSQYLHNSMYCRHKPGRIHFIGLSFLVILILNSLALSGPQVRWTGFEAEVDNQLFTASYSLRSGVFVDPINDVTTRLLLTDLDLTTTCLSGTTAVFWLLIITNILIAILITLFIIPYLNKRTSECSWRCLLSLVATFTGISPVVAIVIWHTQCHTDLLNLSIDMVREVTTETSAPNGFFGTSSSLMLVVFFLNIVTYCALFFSNWQKSEDDNNNYKQPSGRFV